MQPDIKMCYDVISNRPKFTSDMHGNAVFYLWDFSVIYSVQQSLHYTEQGCHWQQFQLVVRWRTAAENLEHLQTVHRTFTPRDIIYPTNSVKVTLLQYLDTCRLLFCDSQSSVGNVRRILVSGVSAPLPPEAKKILKIWLRNGAFWGISE